MEYQSEEEFERDRFYYIGAEGECRNSQAEGSDSDEALEKGFALPTKQPVRGIFQVRRQRQCRYMVVVYLPVFLFVL